MVKKLQWLKLDCIMGKITLFYNQYFGGTKDYPYFFAKRIFFCQKMILRSKLSKSFSEEPGKTLGFYTKNYPDLNIVELAKLMPAEKSFNECWKKAEGWLK
ncbi:hypothetical protein BpHYR1_038644 [Brachionus plicatilis]|uniref:Uncharacterized protein n=1 Tax=Brachionus plicatilis TaxID=10195 RepID=A0A3M7PRG1_BRAPC|nr:hypothetical protein BpHYR1_038644 [Brachionus plicatilis]